MIHVPRSAAPTYPITRPVRATDRPNDPLFDWLASAMRPVPANNCGHGGKPESQKCKDAERERPKRKCGQIFITGCEYRGRCRGRGIKHN